LGCYTAVCAASVTGRIAVVVIHHAAVLLCGPYTIVTVTVAAAIADDSNPHGPVFRSTVASPESVFDSAFFQDANVVGCCEGEQPFFLVCQDVRVLAMLLVCRPEIRC